MIDNDCGTLIMDCDNCSNEYIAELATDYEDLNCEAKEEGWINRQINGEWYNFCSEECYEKKKLKIMMRR
jgi:hypothetical protein